MVNRTTVHLLIKGKVQGVFFRASARETAEQLNLTGWIRNTSDGAVESVVSGDKDAVAQYIAWCRQGPPGAVVTDVQLTEKAEESFPAFQVIR